MLNASFVTGFLLNVFIIYHDGTNRHERRTKSKIGFVIR